MSDLLDIENERIEITDDDGNSVVFRPVAIIGAGEQVYFVFGCVQPTEQENRRQLKLMLVRREKENGVEHYVICDNEKEIEQIVGSYIRQAVGEIIRRLESENDDAHDEDDEPICCETEHAPGEFCFCGQTEYLQ